MRAFHFPAHVATDGLPGGPEVVLLVLRVVFEGEEVVVLQLGCRYFEADGFSLLLRALLLRRLSPVESSLLTLWSCGTST